MAPRSGKNGLIYISGTEITEANAWSVTIDVDTHETGAFADTWKTQYVGLHSWSGSISAWDEEDKSALQDSAVADISVAILIYPVRTTLTDYYSGNAIFSFGSEGDISSAVSNTADFVGAGDLTITGFD